MCFAEQINMRYDTCAKTERRNEVLWMGKSQHVVPVGEKWGIKSEGNSRLTSIFDR